MLVLKNRVLSFIILLSFLCSKNSETTIETTSVNEEIELESHIIALDAAVDNSSDYTITGKIRGVALVGGDLN